MKDYIALKIRFDEDGDITGETFDSVKTQLIDAKGNDAFADIDGFACALCAGFEDRHENGESLCLDVGNTYYLGEVANA